MIDITILGKAEPAGSKRAFRWKSKDGREGTSVVDANPDSRGWKQEVSRIARIQVKALNPEFGVLYGPLRVVFQFYRVRPTMHYLRGTKNLNAEGRRRIAPDTRPDVLKLARGVEDALTHVVWADDAQIVDEHITKHWGEPARVRILIEEVKIILNVANTESTNGGDNERTTEIAAAADDGPDRGV